MAPIKHSQGRTRFDWKNFWRGGDILVFDSIWKFNLILIYSHANGFCQIILKMNHMKELWKVIPLIEIWVLIKAKYIEECLY